MTMIFVDPNLLIYPAITNFPVPDCRHERAKKAQSEDCAVRDPMLFYYKVTPLLKMAISRKPARS